MCVVLNQLPCTSSTTRHMCYCMGGKAGNEATLLCCCCCRCCLNEATLLCCCCCCLNEATLLCCCCCCLNEATLLCCCCCCLNEATLLCCCFFMYRQCSRPCNMEEYCMIATSVEQLCYCTETRIIRYILMPLASFPGSTPYKAACIKMVSGAKHGNEVKCLLPLHPGWRQWRVL